jgi:hypothetical protein
MDVKLITAAALLALLSVHSQAASAAGSMPPKAAAFCSKLQPALQPYIKVPLVLIMADDSTNDEMHAGETQYRHCQFRQADGSMADIGLHDMTLHAPRRRRAEMAGPGARRDRL